MNRVFKKTSATTCAFLVNTINMEQFFVNVEEIEVKDSFVFIPKEALMLIDTVDEKTNIKTKGLIKVGEAKGMKAGMWVEATGISITEVSKDLPISKSIISARSNGLIT